jgi:CubicO group peptidase (beta-lactamase class C family)
MKVLKDAEGPLDAVYDAPRDITIDDLLTHRAGLAYGFTSVGPIASAHQRALGDVLNSDMAPDDWMAALGGLPLSYPPGERFHYSHATDVLGFIVGRIDGKPFRQSLIDRIFKPLGMVDTDFYIPLDKRDRLATVYRVGKTGALEPVPFKLYDEPPAFTGGGGGLVSTVDDYLKFIRLLMNKGELDGVRLARPETIDLMLTNRLTPEQRQIPFMGLPFWMGQGFGLGLSIVDDAEKQAWMGASANGAFSWPGAFGTWWRGDPANNLIMIYMIQNAMPLEPESASQLATGQRSEGMMALPMFQNMTYEALKG